jgi:hypothetical protein
LIIGHLINQDDEAVVVEMVEMDGKDVVLEEVATQMQTHFLSQAPNQCEETS